MKPTIEISRKLTLLVGVLNILMGVYAGWYYSAIFGRFSASGFHIIWTPVIVGTLISMIMYGFIFFRKYLLALAILMFHYLYYLPAELPGDWAEILNLPNWCTSKFCMLTQVILISDILTISTIILLAVLHVTEVLKKKAHNANSIRKSSSGVLK